jgi:RNA polymerase sigma factor for flagellar operon FliA
MLSPCDNHVQNDRVLAEVLWSDWMRHRSPTARNAVANHYRAWMHQIAGRVFVQFRYALAEFGDYVSLGTIGLLGAIENYDPRTSVPFEAYAYHRVRGAILNGLADYSSEFHKSGEGPSSSQAYLAELESVDDGADSLATVIDATVGLAIGLLLDLGARNDGREDPLTIYQSQRESLDLWALVERLPERERFVVTEHYMRFRPFKEIAAALAVSTPRVSQLHYQALRRVKTLYEAL